MAENINDWQPIETAPRDGRTILIFRQSHVALGMWFEDGGARNPKPYWHGSDADSWGRRWARSNPPTHWMPLPSGPVEAR